MNGCVSKLCRPPNPAVDYIYGDKSIKSATINALARAGISLQFGAPEDNEY